MFDHWQRTKHIPEAIAAPTCYRAAHFHTIRDGLPVAWHGSGNVAANYDTADVEGIFEFLTSRELAEAVADGVLVHQTRRLRMRLRRIVSAA